jgi:hypothetical protein
MFTVQVFEKSTGKPAYYKKVSVNFDGFFRGATKDVYTDRDGEAHFDYDNGTGTIYVQGRKVYEGEIRGRKIVYID